MSWIVGRTSSTRLHLASATTRVLGGFVSFIGVVVMGCSSSERPPFLSVEEPPLDAGPADISRDSAPKFDLGPVDTAPVDCKVALEDGRICACTEIAQRPPTVYLVLDKSGSMDEILPPATENKWKLVRLALLAVDGGVLRKLGPKIAVGAAIFPGEDASFVCAPGREIFPPEVGSKDTFDRLATRLSTISPRGATPTATTLRGLSAKLKALPKPVFVLLATDGAPNCGSGTCPIERCSYNIERLPISTTKSCDVTINCCDPAQIDSGLGWQACVDADATNAAVGDLALAGVKTFVLGAPGTAMYTRDLDRLAETGGVPQEGAATKYYAAANATQVAFEKALSAITARVLERCEITLDRPVEDPGGANVVLDGETIAKDPIDGWSWGDTQTVIFSGKSCEKIKKGVSRVQVVIGCKTVTR